MRKTTSTQKTNRCAIIARSGEKFRLVAFALGLALGVSAPAHGEAFERHSLGGHPVCEASAAVLAACPGATTRCLFVGDNEERGHLFVYPLTAQGLDVKARRALPFTALLSDLDAGDRELSDIEALVALPDNGLLIVGSHSRNKRCKPRKSRRRLLGIQVADAGLQAHTDWSFEQAKKMTCKRLFGARRGKLAGQRGRVCDAIQTAETEATRAKKEGSKAACELAGALNVEGAVAVPTATGTPRVWLGLRTPLMGARAILLRR